MVSEAGTRHRSGAGASTRPDLVAAFGVGTLLGIAFLVLTLMGRPMLAWAVLGLAMILALAETALVAIGASGLVNSGSWRRRNRKRACS